MYSSMGVSLSRTTFGARLGKPANPLLSCKAGPKGWWRLSLIHRCFLVPMLFVTGCASDGQGPYWGEEATLSPGWNRIGSAAVEAARDPVTWAPALGAAALQIGDADDETAEWANTNTPLFGSRDTAEDASDGLRAASWGAYLAAASFAPVSKDEGLATKAKALGVGGVAILTRVRHLCRKSTTYEI